MTETTGALAKKLAAVMGAVKRIPKTGRNEFHKYDYATEADIVSAIRDELSSRHVVILPAVVAHQRDGDITTLSMEFLIVDGETGESFSRPWLGVGQDKGDKGAYKGMTGGEKYFLLKTFLVPTGDDPEAEEGQRPSGRPAARQQAPAGRPAAPATSPVTAPVTPSVTPESSYVRTITEPQQKRFFAIGKAKGWTADGVKALLKRTLGVEKSEQIPIHRYNEVVALLETGPEAKAS